jgi:hypothetical protein
MPATFDHAFSVDGPEAELAVDVFIESPNVN